MTCFRCKNLSVSTAEQRQDLNNSALSAGAHTAFSFSVSNIVGRKNCLTFRAAALLARLLRCSSLLSRLCNGIADLQMKSHPQLTADTLLEPQCVSWGLHVCSLVHHGH